MSARQVGRIRLRLSQGKTRLVMENVTRNLLIRLNLPKLVSKIVSLTNIRLDKCKPMGDYPYNQTTQRTLYAPQTSSVCLQTSYLTHQIKND